MESGDGDAVISDWCIVWCADELVVENLRPNTSYLFFVQAKNAVGVGPRQEIRATTIAISKSDSYLEMWDEILSEKN